jgi:hypothetical protein
MALAYRHVGMYVIADEGVRQVRWRKVGVWDYALLHANDRGEVEELMVMVGPVSVAVVLAESIRPARHRLGRHKSLQVLNISRFMTRR